MIGFVIVGCIIGLVISGYLASEFADVADTKGYEKSKYFWICFLFGLAGWLLVVALPDMYDDDE